MLQFVRSNTGITTGKPFNFSSSVLLNKNKNKILSATTKWSLFPFIYSFFIHLNFFYTRRHTDKIAIQKYPSFKILPVQNIRSQYA